MLTRYGVTSAFDTGSTWENTRRLRDRIESGEIPGPRIRSTGEILVPKGGSLKPETLDVIGAMRVQTPEITDVEGALAARKKFLSKDPSKDVRGFGAVQYTIRHGELIYRSGQVARTLQGPPGRR
jgi:hypothetical protein